MGNQSKVKNYYSLLVFLVIALSYAALAFYFLDAKHDWGGDFSQYIFQAISIANNDVTNFISLNRFTILNSSMLVGPVAYPWGFPVLLTIPYYFFGFNLIAFKMVSAICYFLFLATLFFGLRGQHSKLSLYLLVGFFAVNPSLISCINSVLSDIPFLFFSTISIVLIRMIVVQHRIMVNRVIDGILIGFLIAATYLIRPNGILLVPVLFCAQIAPYFEAIRDRTQLKLGVKNICISLTPYFVFMMIAVYMSHKFPSGDQVHVDLLAHLSLKSIFSNFIYNLRLPSEFFGGPRIYIATIFFFYMGVRHCWRQNYCEIIYIALTFLLYVLWPGRQGLRYIYPILPFYFSFMISGCEIVWQKLSNTRTGPPLFFLIAFTLFLFGTYYGFERLEIVRVEISMDGPFTKSSEEMFSYVRGNANDGDVIIFRKPRVMLLLTGRPSLLINQPERLTEGQYLVLDKSKIHDEAQLPLNFPLTLEVPGVQVVFENKQFKVFKLKT